MPRPTWKPAEELTQFALAIREGYMWKRVPNMSMAEFAELAGVSKQSVLHWLRDGAKPKRASVIAVAKATGIDVDELLRIAGHLDTATFEIEKRGAQRVARLLIRDVEQALATMVERGVVSAEGAAAMAATLHERESRYVTAIQRSAEAEAVSDGGDNAADSTNASVRLRLDKTGQKRRQSTASPTPSRSRSQSNKPATGPKTSVL